jgi:dTDP-4-dehydrorhamnose 3,5-epimerase-like enzyme
MLSFIKGGFAEDARGRIRFVNDFDMSQVKRFYIIKNADTDLIRGWRAHRIEQRWFYVLSGSFVIDIVTIDNWEQPTQSLSVEKIHLKDTDNSVFYLSTGYATTIQAASENAELLVFGDYGIEHASEDDYTYPLNYFVNRIEN